VHDPVHDDAEGERSAGFGTPRAGREREAQDGDVGGRAVDRRDEGDGRVGERAVERPDAGGPQPVAGRVGGEQGPSEATVGTVVGVTVVGVTVDVMVAPLGWGSVWSRRDARASTAGRI